jgi:hypothetical protein
MQHAAITLRNENTNSFSDLYKTIDLQKESFDIDASGFFGFNTNVHSSVTDWEFFCNELEYE